MFFFWPNEVLLAIYENIITPDHLDTRSSQSLIEDLLAMGFVLFCDDLTTLQAGRPLVPEVLGILLVCSSCVECSRGRIQEGGGQNVWRTSRSRSANSLTTACTGSRTLEAIVFYLLSIILREIMFLSQ